MKLLMKEELTDFTRCLIEKMLTHSLGRGLGKYDRKTSRRNWTEAVGFWVSVPNPDQ
ncbi:MAG: DUF1585 domain-containing protein [Acidobacteria bacterium]|nr:DUF1585 domain-containing protein [Acidobacteriota bacterium]